MIAWVTKNIALPRKYFWKLHYLDYSLPQSYACLDPEDCRVIDASRFTRYLHLLFKIYLIFNLVVSSKTLQITESQIIKGLLPFEPSLVLVRLPCMQQWSRTQCGSGSDAHVLSPAAVLPNLDKVLNSLKCFQKSA